MRVNDIKISENFKLYEFECKDGNHQVKVHPKLLELAQKLRNEYGAFTPNSAYRTPAYNKKIGGSPTSFHMEGMAIDVPLKSGWTVDKLAALGAKIGFTGIGTYPWGCHFDVRTVPKKFEMRK